MKHLIIFFDRDNKMKLVPVFFLAFQNSYERKIDPVYFTTRVPDTSETSETRTTRVRHKCNTSETRATRVLHEFDTSATRVLHERYKYYTNDPSAKQVREFDFDNGMSDNIFSHPYIIYMINERLQGEEQFHSKNYLLEMSRPHAKMHLKSAPQKFNFVM